MPTVSTAALWFSDIEGSTALLQRIGPAYADVLLRHREIVRRAIRAHDGEEQGTEGDSFFVRFADPTEALQAAVDAQIDLQREPWPPGAEINVRMGLHLGEVVETIGGPIGLAIHHAARVAAAAHGGQIVVSAELRDAVSAGESDVAVRALGRHRLRDVGTVELYQAVHPSLRDEFPPLRSTGPTSNNLPTPITSLVGRTQEIAQVAELLDAHRLVTLTGAGGSGKSRLALAVAARQETGFDGGAWLVELAALTASDQIVPAMADAMGIRGSVDDVLAAVRERPVLLVLDNCEHLLDGCAEAAAGLLSRSSATRIVATSREPLGVSGEAVFRVPSLSVPAAFAGAAEARDADAVRLFCERTRLVVTGFEPGDGELAAIGEITRRLDGIPLAIELAAARMRHHSAAEIARLLDDRFRLLSGGSRHAMARQQTLLATVDWSVRLLSDDERRLLVRLAVFHGSAEVAACVDVCGDPTDELDVVDGLSSLHDKSLVHMVADGTARRFRLPETIRQYALQRLVDSDDIAERRERHARWYLATTDDAFSSGARGAIERVRSLCELDMDNLRASAEWLADRDVPAAIHLLLRLNIMSTFWHGMEWVLAPIVDAVARFDEIAAADRALAHIVLAQSARFSFVDVDAEEHRLAARRALVGVDDPATVALVEAADWFQVIYGNAEAERGQVERAVTAARRSGSAVVRALVAIWIGYPADAALGTRMAHDLIELGEEIDDPVMVAVATLELASGRLAWIGRGDEAVRLVHQVRISLDDLVSDSDRLQIALFTAVLEAEHGDLRVGLRLAEDLRERVLRRPNSHVDRGETAACLAHVRRLAGEHDQVLELAQAAGREFSVVVVEGFLEWVGRLALSAELRRLGRLTEAVDTLTDRLVPRAAGTTDWFARVLEEGVHLALGLGRREVAATLLATAADHRARAGKPLSPRGATELAGVTTELAGSGAAPVSDAAAVELIRSLGSSAG